MTKPARPPASRATARKPAVPTPDRAQASEAAHPERVPHVALRAAAQIIEAQKMLLHAGLRVLRVERDSAASLQAPPASMEEVFDRRVASAMQRLGMPDAAELARLAERLASLDRKLEALQRKARTKRPNRP